VDGHVFPKGESPVGRPGLAGRDCVFFLRKLLPGVIPRDRQEVPGRALHVRESDAAAWRIPGDVGQHLSQLPAVTGCRHVVADDVCAGLGAAGNFSVNDDRFYAAAGATSGQEHRSVTCSSWESREPSIRRMVIVDEERLTGQLPPTNHTGTAPSPCTSVEIGTWSSSFLKMPKPSTSIGVPIAPKSTPSRSWVGGMIAVGLTNTMAAH